MKALRVSREPERPFPEKQPSREASNHCARDVVSRGRFESDRFKRKRYIYIHLCYIGKKTTEFHLEQSQVQCHS